MLFGGFPAKSLQRLQLIQNSAARVLTRTKKSDHITPILAQLHWLPVNYTARQAVFVTGAASGGEDCKALI
ncbi:hypothetical protein J4Q44_G00139500 [Coregonus suidteri]|uniref:Uncharacterized protein n=1 Tax=Coregonus suidteri TaxID=861788 RepID=A0AAN8MFI5_9TELE